MKPIDGDELKQAVQRFITRQLSLLNNKPLYNNFLHNIHAANRGEFKLAIATTEGTFFYRPDEIIRLEGEGNYTKFYFRENRTLLTSKTLKEYEELLMKHGFIRTHKSHIVNKIYVVNYRKEVLLTMTDGSRVKISRRKKEDVMTRQKSS